MRHAHEPTTTNLTGWDTLVYHPVKGPVVGEIVSWEQQLRAATKTV